MASRMDRYYQSNEESKRTTRNSSLYDEIYESRDYDRISSNVSDISVDTLSTTTSHQIDIAEVKALLEKRNEYQRSRQIVKDQPTMKKEVRTLDEDNRIYDVNEMIEKAKEDKNDSYRPRRLADTQVFTLQELVTKKEYSNKEQLDKDDVKDLINTIYNTNLIKKDDKDGILDDLLSSGNTMANPDIKEVLKEKKQELENTNNIELDTSFYTSSLGLKKSDFETFDDENESKTNKLTTIILIIMTGVFIALGLYVLICYVL